MAHSEWTDALERMRQSYEAEKARRAALSPEEVAAEEAERQRRREALDELIALSEEIAADETCGHCGKPRRGYASAGDTPLCHPDGGMDCYRLVTVYKHDRHGNGQCEQCIQC